MKKKTDFYEPCDNLGEEDFGKQIEKVNKFLKKIIA